MKPFPVPAVISRFRDLKLEWLCRNPDGSYFWSATEPHHTFLDSGELEAAHEQHGGVMLQKTSGHVPAHPRPGHPPAARRQEHWLIEWEREHES